MREALETLVQLISPMMPHLAEEMWEVLGHETRLSEASWPKADTSLLKKELATYAVQVNGKFRGTMELPVGVENMIAQGAAKEITNVAEFISGKEIRKVIFVPDKLVNFVVA